jgi:Amt family ammonium transporter
LTQLLGATICAVWAFGSTYGVFWAVNKVKSIRVSPEVELEGLDMPEFGAAGYPEDAPLTVAA